MKKSGFYASRSFNNELSVRIGLSRRTIQHLVDAGHCFKSARMVLYSYQQARKSSLDLN